jgi:hypothetical protein
MPDVLDVLGALPQAVTPGPARAETVAEDVTRGHRALARRRRRITCSGAGVAVIAAVAVAVAASQPGLLGHSPPPAAAGTRAIPQTSTVRLVAYTGPRPIGFIVSTVPAGWKVAHSDRVALVLVPPGASTSEPSQPGQGQVVLLAGRLSVMLQAGSRLPGNSPVTKVTVNGRPAVLGFPYGGKGATRDRWLIFSDAKGRKVLVQVPESLDLTTDQIVRFAEGITVTSQAQPIGG